MDIDVEGLLGVRSNRGETLEVIHGARDWMSLTNRVVEYPETKGMVVAKPPWLRTHCASANWSMS